MFIFPYNTVRCIDYIFYDASKYWTLSINIINLLAVVSNYFLHHFSTTVLRVTVPLTYLPLEIPWQGPLRGFSALTERFPWWRKGRWCFVYVGCVMMIESWMVLLYLYKTKCLQMLTKGVSILYKDWGFKVCRSVLRPHKINI